MIIIIQSQRIYRRINTQTLRHCNCSDRFVMMFSISLNFFVNFFAYVITCFFVGLGHSIDIYLELLLLCSYFVPIFFFFVKVLQMLFSFTIFIVTKDWLLSMLIFKIKIIKSLILLVLLQTFSKIRQVLQKW